MGNVNSYRNLKRISQQPWQYQEMPEKQAADVKEIMRSKITIEHKYESSLCDSCVTKLRSMKIIINGVDNVKSNVYTNLVDNLLLNNDLLSIEKQKCVGCGEENLVLSDKPVKSEQYIIKEIYRLDRIVKKPLSQVGTVSEYIYSFNANTNNSITCSDSESQ